MSELGVDFSCVTDVDENLSLVTGRVALAHAIARRWLATPGSLFYDPTYGAGLGTFINGAWVVSDTELAAKLEAQALRDERVDSASVLVDYSREDSTLTVTGFLEDEDGPFTLVLKAADMQSTSTDEQPAVDLFLSEL